MDDDSVGLVTSFLCTYNKIKISHAIKIVMLAKIIGRLTFQDATTPAIKGAMLKEREPTDC